MICSVYDIPEQNRANIEFQGALNFHNLAF